MAHIRLAKPSDEEALIHIFRETAAPDLRAKGDPVLHIASYIWCRPYPLLEPNTCFVVDDGQGKAVGYILGVPDTKKFVRRYKDQYVPCLEKQGIQRGDPNEPADWDGHMENALRFIAYSPENMLHEDFPALLQDYPGHLHIDILPDWQRHGFGRRLIDELCLNLGQHQVGGVHLIMAGANVDAGKFYARVGFRRFDLVLDGGKSGEVGRDKNDGIWLVRRLLSHSRTS